MALSNWDTLAFDMLGQPCDGTLAGFDGASVAIYKNWLYVRDPKMWTAKRRFDEPTIVQVNSGDLTVSEFAINAVRHDAQAAMFVLVTCSRYDPYETKWMAGIGCDGYSNPTDAIIRAAGQNPNDWEECYRGSSFGPDGSFHTVTCMSGDRTEHFRIPWTDDLDAKWTGVLATTRDAFFAWLEPQMSDYGGPSAEWLAKCRASGGLRFNQGDMYFVDHGVLEPNTIATPVEQAEEPTFSKIIRMMDG